MTPENTCTDRIRLYPIYSHALLGVNLEPRYHPAMDPTDADDITSTQCRMARVGLRWTAKELGQKAKVGRTTILRFERELVSPLPSTKAALRRALESGGASFAGTKTVTIA